MSSLSTETLHDLNPDSIHCLIFTPTGLDLGQVINGYVYHTKYDRVDAIPRGAIQNTGDNVLGLVRGLSNATELYNMEVNYHINYYLKLLNI